MTIWDAIREMQVIKSGEKTESKSIHIKEYKEMALTIDNDNIYWQKMPWSIQGKDQCRYVT